MAGKGFDFDDSTLKLALWATIITLSVFAIAIAGAIALPILIVLGIAKAIHWYVTLPPRTPIIAQAVHQEIERANFPTPQEFARMFFVRYQNECTRLNLTPAGYNTGVAFIDLAAQLYAVEELHTPAPRTRRVIEHTVADGEYRDDLISRSKKAENPDRTLEIFTQTLLKMFLGFTSCLPAPANEQNDQTSAEKSGISVNLIDLMPDTRKAVEYLISPFYAADALELDLFAGMRKQIDRNLEAVNPKSTTLPTETKLGALDTIAAYLGNTGLAPLFSVRVSWSLPQEYRFEHQWIVTPQGGGKTTFIQYQLLFDMARVIDDEASVVVMDSQGDLIKLVSGVALVPPEKLLIIEPDPSAPLALNLFDLGKSRAATYDDRTREMLDINALELLTYVFDTLLGTATTPKQTALFRHSIRLCRAIPGATILTLQEILGSRKKPYPDYVATLPQASQDFFERLFVDDKQFGQTKQEVSWRLSLMLENSTFAGMFSQKESKLDLFTELNSGKLILINTDKSLLKQEGTELFGRFFIALLLQAAQERALIERKDRMPTFVYIDEAHDYIAHDTNITVIFDQARKMNMGLVLAHQRTAQLDAAVLDALTNASIKCARAVSDSGAHVLARNMATTPDFIQKQPVGSFAIALRNQPAISIKVPHGVMERMPRRSAEEMAAIKTRMREKYSVPPSPKQETVSVEPQLQHSVPEIEVPPPAIPNDDPDQRPTQWPRGTIQ